MRGEVTQDPTKKQKYYDEVLGAEARALFPGDEVQQFPGERPSKNTRDYWQDQIALVCAAVGIPHQIAFPESIQGTVERSVLDMADAFFRARSGVIALASVNVYRLVLEWGIRTNAPGLRPAPPDWRRVTVRPPRSINVDLGYKSSAELKALAAGATNYDLIFGPLGLDWREEFRKLKEQIDYAKSIGLDLEELARVMKGGAPQQAAPGKKEDAE
jgi:capsid protein